MTFLRNLQELEISCNFLKQETLAQLFSCNYCEIFNNTFFAEYIWLSATEYCKILKIFESRLDCYIFSYDSLWQQSANIDCISESIMCSAIIFIQQQSQLEAQLFYRILRLKGWQEFSLQFLSNFDRKIPYCT